MSDLFSYRMTEPYRGEAPHVSGSKTSREAGESVKDDLQRMERLVFSFIEERGKWGSTCDEFEKEHPEITHQCASARFRTLELKERIEKTEITRPTRSKRQATVYRVKA